MVTKIGAAIIGVFIFSAFAVESVSNYFVGVQVANLKAQPVVITKTIIVTSTVEPSATPSAQIKTRISTPAKVTK